MHQYLGRIKFESTKPAGTGFPGGMSVLFALSIIESPLELFFNRLLSFDIAEIIALKAMLLLK